MLPVGNPCCEYDTNVQNMRDHDAVALAAQIVLSQGVAGLPVLLECLADAQAQGSVEWEEQVALAFDLQVRALFDDGVDGV